MLHRLARFLVPALTLAALAIRCPAQSVVFTSDTSISESNTQYEGYAVTVRGCVLTIDGAHTFQSLAIERNATNQPGVVTHTAGFASATVHGLQLTISGSMSVQGQSGALSASRIDVTGRGYPEGQGPGTPTTGGGATGGGGHGGRGGNGGSQAGGVCYDLLTGPVTLGSGAGITYGYGGAGSGGGALRLIVGGTLTVDGQLLAVGGSAPATHWGGGGSGGSLWITAATLAGTGHISADGGAAGNTTHGGGGGGGRVAVLGANRTFTGTLSAVGGTGLQPGGAGTVYFKRDAEAFGQVRLDNGGSAGNLTELNAAFWPSTTFALTLAGGALAHPYGGPLTFESVAMTTGAVLSHDAGQQVLDVIVRGALAIDASSRVDTIGRGFPEGQGPGTPTPSGGATGGGGHGGRGGNGGNQAGGPCYELVAAPTQLGSGAGITNGYGGAGSGGGAVRLQVAGTLTVDGQILVSGGAAVPGSWGGGGSGGSIWITAGTFAGSGTLAAEGGPAGNTTHGGGGGGGRIAITSQARSFTGTLSAVGGTGGQRGAAGTIYLKRDAEAFGQVSVDNGGAAGNVTELNAAFWPGLTFGLTLAGGALAHPYGGALLFESLSLTTGAVVSHDAGQVLLDFTVRGDLTIDLQSRFDVSVRGYPEGQGPGTPTPGGGATGGGGHGGRGGNGASQAGGLCNELLTLPLGLGSGAGITYGYGGAGTGGGAVRLLVFGTLTVDGEIKARGGDAVQGSWGGGGAGGSVLVFANGFAGTGTIAADGGHAGDLVHGGGGGGGRIAVHSVTQGFRGTFSARGGLGGQTGGAGTVYTRGLLAAYGALTIDNGGATGGAVTELRSSFWSTSDLLATTVRGAARVHPIGNVSLLSLTATGGALFGHESLGLFDVVVWGDASFDATTVINVDAMGFPEGQGPGTPTPGGGATGGGGHGGRGGAGQSSSGGPRYGSQAAPTTLGSGGGVTYGYGPSGTGGGAVRLHVGGGLRLDGQISARGSAAGAGGWGAGGSGGSVYLAAGQWSGTGQVTVAGGANGDSVHGGGGGGGRIAVYYLGQSFTGQLSAAGGTGYVNGETGTIYLRQGVPPTWNTVRNGNFELGSLPPWSPGGGGVLPQLEVFDVTGLGATTAFGVEATSAPLVLTQSVALTAGARYWFAADFAARNGGTTADPDGGQWQIRVAGALIASGRIGPIAIGQTLRRRTCTLFTPAAGGAVDLELRILRTTSTAGVRTYVDNVEILPGWTPVSCVEDPRIIGTTVTWKIAGSPSQVFVVYLGAGVLDSGVTVPGANGVWYLSPLLMLPVFSGVLDGNGAWQTAVPLPNDPWLVGAPLWFQGLEVNLSTLQTSLGLLQNHPLILP